MSLKNSVRKKQRGVRYHMSMKCWLHKNKRRQISRAKILTESKVSCMLSWIARNASLRRHLSIWLTHVFDCSIARVSHRLFPFTIAGSIHSAFIHLPSGTTDPPQAVHSVGFRLKTLRLLLPPSQKVLASQVAFDIWVDVHWPPLAIHCVSFSL